MSELQTALVEGLSLVTYGGEPFTGEMVETSGSGANHPGNRSHREPHGRYISVKSWDEGGKLKKDKTFRGE